jgi:hypothetical protein
MAAGVFISFRPEDAAWAARIRGRLQRRLVVWKRNDLGRGVRFANALKTRAGEVEAVVLIIGKNWLAGMVDDPSDRVRIEIEAALERKIRVIPVLVDGASMPSASALPDSLKILAHLKPNSDIMRLVETPRYNGITAYYIELPFPRSDLGETSLKRIARPSRENTARRSAWSRTAATKSTGKKAAAKRAPARRRVTKTAAPKGVGKKGGAKKAAPRKAVTKKAVRKGAAKKAAAKKPAVEKPAVKKAARPTPAEWGAPRDRLRGTVNQDLSVNKMEDFASARRSAARAKEHYGVNISGNIGSFGGDIVGGDKIVQTLGPLAIKAAFRPLDEALKGAPPEAAEKLAALKGELAKGKNANDSVVAKLVDGFVGIVPGAASAVVGAFGTPILGGIAGPVTVFVLDRLGADVAKVPDKLPASVESPRDSEIAAPKSSVTKASDPIEEIVECSVFGPPAAPPGKTILIQVFLHLANQTERASFLASTMDASAKLKATKSLELPIRRGAHVEVAFSANGLEVDDPVESVVWRGQPAYCQFLATIPAASSGQSFFPVVRVSVDRKLVGCIKFRLSSDAAASQPVSEPLGDHAGPYKYAFVSYASKDRKEVLKRVQMLEILKTKFFQDVLSLDPGDRWEKKLYENIDRCDLFLLFWSQAAKDSQWVLKEAEYALAHQRENPHSEPDLVPVVLEQNVVPPPGLSAFHFNDRIQYLISLMP